MEMSPEARKVFEASGALRGARDFFLAYRILGARRSDPEVEASGVPWPLQAHVTCAAFALELVLKASKVRSCVLSGRGDEMGAKAWKEIRRRSPLSDAQRADDDGWARRELERLQAAEREPPMARTRDPKGGPKD